MSTGHGPASRMRLSDFIRANADKIIDEWERYASTCLPAAGSMEITALRDHAAELLNFIDTDMESAQSDAEQSEKAEGHQARSAADSEAEKHAILRVADGFTIDQVVGEFRALRASVLHLYAKRVGQRPDAIQLIRFNEAIDQMLSESVARHTKLVADRLREDNRQKDEFISILSHELRNPLGAITSCAHVLRASGEKDPAIARAVDILTRQTQHLGRLLEDVLDVARILRTRTIIRLETADLRTCVRDAVEANQQLIDKKQQTLKLDLPSTSLTANVDCTRVTQVISNLINNAAKYSPTCATVAVSLSEESDHALIVVKDDGAGIDPQLLPHIFNAFHDNRRSSDEQGLGIGLWLSQQLVQLQDGTITARSAGPGTGAKFSGRLPLLKASARAWRSGA
jgi:signal transduction histidine kinase